MNRVRLALFGTTLWRCLRIAGLGLLVGAFCLALFPSARAAASDGPCGTLASGSDVYIDCTVPPAAAPYATFTDGDPINLSMGPNSVFSLTDAAGGDVQAIECEYTTGSAPGDPPNANFCSSQTLSGGWPFTVNSDGSFDYASATGGPLNIYAVPGANFPGATITCDATDPCVWYVGENYNSFTAPHVFSNPFVVNPAAGTTTTTTVPTTTTTTAAGSTTTTSSTTTTTTAGSTTTTSSTTTTTPSGSTTSTTAASTTTTTAGSGATTSTTSLAAVGLGASSGGGSGSGAGDDTSASAVQLAFTGASPVIVWMLGLGLLLLIGGTAGRLTIGKTAR